MKTLLRLIIVVITSMTFLGCASGTREKEMDTFITSHVEQIKRLQKGQDRTMDLVHS